MNFYSFSPLDVKSSLKFLACLSRNKTEPNPEAKKTTATTTTHIAEKYKFPYSSHSCHHQKNHYY